MSRAFASRSVVPCLVCLLAGGSVGMAQAPAQKSETGVVATLAVIGCLERWAPEPGTATDSAPAKPPAGVEFMLTHAEGQTTSATATTGVAQSAPRQERYLLLPAKGLDYAAHLNHRVRVTGTIAPQPSTGASPAQQVIDPSSRETNLPATAEAESYGGTLVDVSALAMVARSCGP
jgi:hypothetical protein